MIHNERERLAAKDQLEYLRSELEKRSDGEHTEVAHGVVSALRTQIAIVEEQLAEYEYLKEGLTKVFEADSLDEFGDLVTKARIARGWSQAELAKALEMEPQQIQRYEKNDWQKISLWRLQEIVEALGLDIAIHARLREQEEQNIGPSHIISSHEGLYPSAISSLGLGIGATLGDLSVGVVQALSNVSMGIGGVLGALPMTVSDAAHGVAQTVHNDTQTMLQGSWYVSGGVPVLRLAPRRATTQQGIGTPAVTPQQQSEVV